MTRRTCSLAAGFIAFGLVLAGSASAARADGFAEPPGPHRAVIASGEHTTTTTFEFDPGLAPRLSPFRIMVGPAMKADAHSALPGLLVAVDLGRGPAGFRVSGAWLDVGNDRGVSQYTGELTLDFGGRSAFRPMLGVGGGYARTSSTLLADKTLDGSTGTSMAIGVARLGLGYRLPFEDTDARLQLDVGGSLPAIRSASSPQTTPWLTSALTLAIGL